MKFKEGDLVICDDASEWEGRLTKGKYYTVISISSGHRTLRVIDDSQREFGYYSWRFTLAIVDDVTPEYILYVLGKL